MSEKSKSGGEVEVLDSDTNSENINSNDNFIALISQQTERPDLLIDALEKHDPGFVKRMNERSIKVSDELRQSKFKFGERQAYTGLTISSIVSLACMGFFGYVIYYNQLTFLSGFLIIVFYVVSQSGPTGFLRIVNALSEAIANFRNKI